MARPELESRPAHHRQIPRVLRATAALMCLVTTACGGGDDGVDAGPPDSGAVYDSGVGPDQDLDQWADGTDNCPSVANPEQRDRDADGLGDACDPCPATPNGGVGDQAAPDACEQIEESEPNDSMAQSQAIALPEPGRALEIRGAIEAPTADGQAYDRFQVMVGAQTLLRVRVARLSPDSLLEPLLLVSGPGFTKPRQAEGRFVAERLVYFAEAGTYEIAVADRRGVRDETPFGAPTYAYGLSVQALVSEPAMRTPPLNAEPFVIDERGEVFILELDLEASDFTLLSAATDLDLLGVGADTILVLERSDGTVVENDSLSDGYSDARIIADFPAPERVRVVLDHARVFGAAPHEVRLTIAQPDVSRELEPNNTPDLASELVFPGETSGNISAPLDPEVGPPDLDWYFIDGNAGQVIALSGLIRPASVSNPVMALVRVHDLEAEDVEVLYQNTDSSADAPRIEAILPDTTRYHVIVGEEQNLQGPPFAGGPLFEYGVFAEATGIQPDPEVVTTTAAIDGVLDPGGRLKRHLVVTTGPTLVFIDTESTGRDVENDPVEPFYRVYGAGGRGLLGEGGPEVALAFLPRADTYVLGVHNQNNGLGGPSATYQSQVSYQSVSLEAEREPNDTPTEAMPIIGWRAAIEAEITDASDVDVFRFSATAGQRLDAVTTEGGRRHRVRVLDEAGAVIALGNASVTGVDLPADGAYFIVVDTTLGPYKLLMRVR